MQKIKQKLKAKKIKDKKTKKIIKLNQRSKIKRKMTKLQK